MPHTRDFLDRFRPAGAPGAAGRAGVPADRAAELASELGPVLALLADTHAECGCIIDAARRDAAQITEQARQQAAALTADAQRRARVAQDATVGQLLAAAHAEADEAVKSATAQADRRRASFSDGRADRLATLAVDMLRALPIEGPAGNGSPAPAGERGTPVSEPEGAAPPGLRSEGACDRATREGGASRAPAGERGTQ